MDDRKVIKQTQKVIFRMSDDSEVKGEVFLGLYEARHTGPQKVGDLLNEPQAFVPVKTGHKSVLLNVSQIATVTVDSKFEKDELMTLGKKYAVLIKMTYGKDIAGDIFVNLPEETLRVKDYFNQTLQFVTVFKAAAIIYINRRFILSIEG